jgi:hypothetical protein
MLRYSIIFLMSLFLTPVFALTVKEEAARTTGEAIDYSMTTISHHEKSFVVGFEFKEEVPAQTAEQRCRVDACNKACTKAWTHKLDKNGDDGAIEVSVCQELCAKQKPYCLTHEGSGIEFPKIPKSDMHDLAVVYCAKVNDEFCQGFK